MGVFNTIILIKFSWTNQNCRVWEEWNTSCISQFALAGIQETVLSDYKCKKNVFASVLNGAFFVSMKKKQKTNQTLLAFKLRFFSVYLAQTLNHRSKSNYFQKPVSSVFMTFLFHKLFFFKWDKKATVCLL